jgi:DNA-binding transcriptional MerR regulator/methylmalonyl-CoA mutase cobalamin-binding subunit
MTGNGNLYPIGVVERDTGIGRDTLRIWERRYGFPEPLRNDKGERTYTEAQLRRLQRIRRLLDQGMRPGKLVPLGEQALDELEAGLQSAACNPDARVNALLDAILSTDTDAIDTRLRSAFDQQGMQAFILDTVDPLLNAVGEYWASGRLEIYQEHFFSVQLIRFLNIEISRMQKTARKPVVLLATLPGEQHTLGLLMVAAMLSAHGISAINLGGEVPMDQISRAVNRFRVDTVGITFSSSYQYSQIRAHLAELRDLLPSDVDIWAGGEGVRRLRKLPPGVVKINSLDKLPL